MPTFCSPSVFTVILVEKIAKKLSKNAFFQVFSPELFQVKSDLQKISPEILPDIHLNSLKITWFLPECFQVEQPDIIRYFFQIPDFIRYFHLIISGVSPDCFRCFYLILSGNFSEYLILSGCSTWKFQVIFRWLSGDFKNFRC